MFVEGGATTETLAERYREGERALDGACPLDFLADGGFCAPITHPSMRLLADNECEHGRLPGDRLDGEAPNWPHAHPCGCWPSELPRVTPVARPSIDLTPKEPLMLTVTTPERAAEEAAPEVVPAVAAPAEVAAEATPDDAESRVREALAAAANVAPPTPRRRVTPVAHVTTNTMLGRIVADLDAEIARLQAARDALAEVIA